MENLYDKDRPGAIGFTSGFSQDSISITVGVGVKTDGSRVGGPELCV